ncbi:MAG: electron transport complex subunit RsxC [Clostridiales bacterium]|nr:electron transport complex subunit RsxC [Clostridiales bacterium]
MALTFRGGVHPDDKKELTRKKAFETIPAPATVVIPMLMHIGQPCQPLVAKGNKVKLGQKIGESTAPISAPIHSSVSGTVVAVEPRLHPNGNMVMSVVIENDFNDTLDESVRPHGSVESLSADELIRIIREAGIVGLGGAAFPTHAKIQSGLGKVDTLIINCAECEPYITSGHRTMLERPEEIIGGIRVLMKIYRLDSAIIAIESNKLDAVRVLEKALPQKSSQIKIKVLKTKYPQGAEKQLIYTVTGREVPPGQLPAAVGCAVFNQDTCAAIHNAVTTGMPLVTRGVTVSGSAIANPKNIICRIGTPLSELAAAAGGYREEPFKLIMGGPMMGVALTDVEIPVIKNTNAFLAFSQYEDVYSEHPTCIRCGRCVKVCPMNLLPIYMHMYYQKDMFDELEKLNVSDCIECGCCSYTCPGRLFLTQTFRVAKARLRKRALESKKEAN